MNPKNILATLIILTAFTSHAKALSGTVSVAGTGCTKTGESALTRVSSSANRYRIPINLNLQKNNLATIARKACAFRLPIELAPNEKIVVRNLAQSIKLSADKNTEVQSQLEVFIAGTSSKPIINKIKATNKSVQLLKTIRANGIIAQSACGTSSIVSGNLSALANGESKASASIGALDISIAIERCN